MRKPPEPINNNGAIALKPLIAGKRFLLTGYGKFGDNVAMLSAKQFAQKLYADYITGNLREDLDFYTPKWQEKTMTEIMTKPEKLRLVSILGLFDEWVAYKLPSLSEKTQDTYKNHRRLIVRLSLNAIGWDVLAIRKAILDGTTPYQAKCLCQSLQAVSLWSFQHGKLDKNYFEMLSNNIPTGRNEPNPKPFTVGQKQAILHQFGQSRYYSHYADFVTFMFETGCRTCEAIGLQWKHIDLTNRKLTLGRSIAELGNGTKSIRETSKNDKLRTFPMNDALIALFSCIEHGKSDDLVFTSPEKLAISSRMFRRRAWDKCLTAVGIDAKTYTPYSTRDTFITMALDKDVPVRVIAKLVDNSPEIIHKHYAGWIREIEAINF